MRSLSTDAVEDQLSALFPASPGSLHSSMTLSVGGLRMAQEFTHQPVLVHEVAELFAPVPAGVIVDATMGGAGHDVALLTARADIGIFGIDRDPVALAAAQENLSRFGGRAAWFSTEFSYVVDAVDAAQNDDIWPEVIECEGVAPIVGLLADLGVSSPQLDVAERGFSFAVDGPLDMRMDQRQGRTAAEYLDHVSLAELTTLLRQNGEGKFAARIARALKEAAPLTTTSQVVEVVDRAVPKANRRRGHVAARVFQALRIAVNEESEELASLLDHALELVGSQGRIVVISYHSGEDALVKHTFRDWESGGCTCPSHLPCVCGAVSKGRVVTKRAITASSNEVAANPRARSARLRAFEVAA